MVPFSHFLIFLPSLTCTISWKKAKAWECLNLCEIPSLSHAAFPLALRLGLPLHPFAPGKFRSSCRSRPGGISFASACSSGRKRAPNVGIELFKGVGRKGAEGMCASGSFPRRWVSRPDGSGIWRKIRSGKFLIMSRAVIS